MNGIGAGQFDLLTLVHAASEAQDAVEAKLGVAGLSLAKLSALKALAEAGEPLPLTQLAERLSCVKSNITQLVDRLEADGFVVREADPHDRRAKLASLTPAGRTACTEGTRIHQDAERDLLGLLTHEESGQLATLLAKLKTPAP